MAPGNRGVGGMEHPLRRGGMGGYETPYWKRGSIRVWNTPREAGFPGEYGNHLVGEGSVGMESLHGIAYVGVWNTPKGSGGSGGYGNPQGIACLG